MKLGPIFPLLFLAPLQSMGYSPCSPWTPPHGLQSMGCITLPMDCSDIRAQNINRSSGVYTIYPNGSTSAVQVFCDMESQGGNWTVFQRRMDGTVNFYRPWEQYKVGFGSAAGEYWLGLENIHHLTLQRRYELLVDMEDFEGNKVFARYSSFSVKAECDGYKLKVSGFSDGGAGDALSSHNGLNFSTFDRDQDVWPNNCARRFIGAFWYGECHFTNPNGVYRWGADNTVFAISVCWHPYKGYDYSLKTFSMKIRHVAPAESLSTVV